MKTNLLILVGLFAALAAQAAPGDSLTKSASGTTTAQALFPARDGRPRVVSYDVTADNATNRILFYSGTTRGFVAKAQVANTTTCVLRNITFTTNDVLIFDNAAGITNKTVTIAANTTNVFFSLMKTLGTNLAIGDTFSERLPTPYRPLALFASDATTLRLDATTGLDTNDVIVLVRGDGFALKKATVATVVPTTNAYVTLTVAAPIDVAIGSTVYRELYGTNISIKLAAAAAATNFFIGATNGMAASTNLLVETSTGNKQVLTIHSFSGTNVNFTAGLNFAVTTNDFVSILGMNTTTILPQRAGESALILSSSTGISNAHTLIVGGSPPYRAEVAAAPASTNIFSITVSAALGATAGPGNSIYKLTNTFTVKLVANDQDSSVVADASTGLVTGDPIVISPASGGVFANNIGPVITSDIITTLTFGSAIGLALTVGDNVWLEGNSANSLIGAATLRREAESLYSASPGAPLRVLVTGAAACSINSVTVNY